jgi:hypothetical protein
MLLAEGDDIGIEVVVLGGDTHLSHYCVETDSQHVLLV